MRVNSDRIGQVVSGTMITVVDSDGADRFRVSFIAQTAANVKAVADAPARVAAQLAAMKVPAMFAGRAATRVRCPSCRAVLAVLVADDRCLYRPGAEWGTLGAPFDLDRTADVILSCQKCRMSFNCSGRLVARRVHNGRPPLG